MNKKINSLQAVTLIIIPILSTFIGIGIDNIVIKSKVDAYLSPIIAFILGLPIVLLILYIYNYKKDLPIKELLLNLYGNILGNILNIILILVYFIIASTILYSLCNFITSQFLSETPVIIIATVFILIVINLITKGIEVISRVSLILTIICLILFAIGTFLLLPQIDLSNIKPFLSKGMTPPLISSINIISVNILPIFILLSIPKNNIVNNKKYNKYAISTYIISICIMFIFIFATLATLGIYLVETYQYPEYIVLKKINLFNFINRVENLISIQWVYGIFIYLTYIIYYITTSIKKEKNNFITYIISILLIMSIFIFKNNTIYNYFCYHYLPLITAIIFPIIIITSIIIYIKKKFKHA